MSSSFYRSIIEDEIQSFGIKEGALKVAATSVRKTYGHEALHKGKTFLDYNIPSNRCAYLYKFAAIHTSLVSKYFCNMIKKKPIKSILKKKDNLKVCCLGGGPGTDIVGLFQAMALNPFYHEKVIEVTVLDICGGWRNSFNRIIAHLTAGKIKSIPTTFIDKNKFKYKLIEVNLLNSLPANVVSVLSEADIVCMVKFISAILGVSSSVPAVKNIASMLKCDTVVLFVDNFQGNVFKALTDLAEQIGLETVAGPLHAQFTPKTGYKPGQVSAAEKRLFGCLPSYATKVTVLAFRKTVESYLSDTKNLLVHEHCHIPKGIENFKKDDNNKLEVKVSAQITNGRTKSLNVISSDKFTQTNISDASQVLQIGPKTQKELSNLIHSLGDLLVVLQEWQEKE